MEEVWKDIIGFEGVYQVSNLGRVKGLPYRKKGFIERDLPERIKNTYTNHKGYLEVSLSNNGHTKRCFVHRLVMKAFIENTENKPQVNHINGIKTDNRLENLEWITNLENQRHSYKTGLDAYSKFNHNKSKIILDTNTGIFYKSITDAAKSVGVNKTTLACWLRGVYKSKTNRFKCV